MKSNLFILPIESITYVSMRLKRIMVVFLFLITVACNKDKAVLGRKYAALNGTWIGIGEEQLSYSPPTPDVFTEFRISVINDVVIKVNSTPLFFNDARSNDDTALFLADESQRNAGSLTSIAYCARTGDITHIHSGSNYYAQYWSRISTSSYRPNALVKLYTSQVAGTKQLSGTIHVIDRYVYPLIDSSYELNYTLSLTMVNDSTILIANPFLRLGDSLLHYKSTDYAAGTVTFENFHSGDAHIVTIKLDYNTKLLSYKEWELNSGGETTVELR